MFATTSLKARFSRFMLRFERDWFRFSAALPEMRLMAVPMSRADRSVELYCSPELTTSLIHPILSDGLASRGGG